MGKGGADQQASQAPRATNVIARQKPWPARYLKVRYIREISNAVYRTNAKIGVEWRTAKHVSMFASAKYDAMTDFSKTVTGKAGLRVGF